MFAASNTSYLIGEDLIKGLVKKILEMNENIKILTSVVQNLSNRSDESNDQTLPDDIQLPLSSLQEVDALEVQLESSNLWKEKLVSCIIE